MARSRRRARPWGAGTLYRRADGRWAAQLFVTESGTGRRVRRTIYGSTSDEVEEKRDALLGAEARREPIPPSKLTVGIYLREWLEHVARPRVRANTFASYQNYVERYLVLDLGQKSLGRLSAREVRMYLDGLRRGGVGDRTVQYVHATLRAALEDAVREELIGKNVAKLVRVPRPAVAEREPLSVDEIRSLLRAHRAQDLLPMLVVFALLGMRRSEVLGLKWDDVDLHLGTLRIHRGLQRIDGVLVELPTKTKRSRRTVPLPPYVVQVLRQHSDSQQKWKADAGGTFRGSCRSTA